MSDRFAR